MSSATPKITNARRAAGAAALTQHLVERTRLLALGLFFVSGVSALIYEVAWVRMLSLSFGVSVYAVSTVLSVYMGGFALGSWLFGRRASHPLALAWAARFNLPPALVRYVALQAGIGVYALLTPALFGGLTTLYAAAGQSGMLSPASGAVLRIVLAVLALVVPTTLMGGTLPVLSQYLASWRPGRARVIGSLYAANTLGAVLGTLAAGLVLIRFAGTHAAIYVAAVLDLLVALVAVRALRGIEPEGAAESATDATADTRIQAPPRPLSRKQKRNAARAEAAAASVPAQAAAPITARQRQIVLWGYALSGFAALGYQVVWTRLLSIFTLNAVFSFTIMLATFLAGLAIGSSVLAGRSAKVRRPLTVFGALQLATGISAILVLFVFAKLPT
ncbi:MAG TPA: fused MFS/spermidine synthase, partial [Roseiflexaceae bacterium]|nr:fused MFS/spermidine synthase [Roseiflexaceae bacterium]